MVIDMNDVRLVTLEQLRGFLAGTSDLRLTPSADDRSLRQGRKGTGAGAHPALRAAAVPRFVAEVMPYFASGALRPHIDCVMYLAELPAAKARMEAGAHMGKIVVRMAADGGTPNRTR
jgi:NADPH:quinone reductase-like Zn-dependent oxidoreductase